MTKGDSVEIKIHIHQQSRKGAAEGLGPDLNVLSKLNSLDTVEGHFLRARTGIIKVRAGFLLTLYPLCHSDAAHRRLDISIKCFKRYNYYFRGQNVPHFPFLSSPPT